MPRLPVKSGYFDENVTKAGHLGCDRARLSLKIDRILTILSQFTALPLILIL